MSAQYYQSTEVSTKEHLAGGHESHVYQQNPSYNVVKPKITRGKQPPEYVYDTIDGNNPGSTNMAMPAPNVVHILSAWLA